MFGKRGSERFLNLHTISFLTIAILLTLFCVIYGDWYRSKITGAVTDEEYQTFYENWFDDYGINRDYQEEVSACLESGKANDCEGTIFETCLNEIYYEIDPRDSRSCAYILENYYGSNTIADPEAYQVWADEHITPYLLTSECQDYHRACLNGEDCNGLIYLPYNHAADALRFFESVCIVPEETDDGQTIEGSTKPPEVVVEEVSKKVDSVKESADYAESIKELISSKPTTEADLVRYKANLEEAIKKARENYQESYSASSKYSSIALSEYQQQIASDLSTINKVNKDVNDILTQTVTQRFEKQEKQAEWELEHEEEIKEGQEVLARFAPIPLVIVKKDNSVESNQNLPALEVFPPSKILIEFGTSQTTDLYIRNNGNAPLEDCRLTFLENDLAEYDIRSWFTFSSFDHLTLLPGENSMAQININPDGLPIESSLFFQDFKIACSSGQTDVFSLGINLEFPTEISSGDTGQMTLPQVTSILERYPSNTITSECQGIYGECLIEDPNTCGEWYELYQCGVLNNCLAYADMCLISSNQLADALHSFINYYVVPYVELPLQCTSDVSLCSEHPSECPDYIRNCAISGQCDEYNSLCINAQSTQAGSSAPSSGGSGGGLGIINSPLVPTNPGQTNTGPVITDNNQLVNACKGDLRCISLADSCLTPSYVIATSLDLADFGGFGYNGLTGQLCYIGDSDVFAIQDYVGPSGLIKIPKTPGSSTSQNNGANGARVVSVHFQTTNSESANRNYVAAVVSNLNGHLTVSFFNSPDYNGLEDKIYDFIQKLIYGEVGESYITGMSLQQAEEIVNDSRSIPWILWTILLVMIGTFVIFGDLLSPYDQRLIAQGKRALNKKDYAQAINSYNELATLYATDSKVKQDALNYLKSIKENMGSSKINLEFHNQNSLPKIKTNNHSNLFSNYSRVEKMIEHSLEDITKSPKLVKSRMHIISKEYSRLDNKDKERLAQKYESLVYKLRNIK
jgi:hypothetical protein